MERTCDLVKDISLLGRMWVMGDDVGLMVETSLSLRVMIFSSSSPDWWKIR